jgi:hypothetical protein
MLGFKCSCARMAASKPGSVPPSAQLQTAAVWVSLCPSLPSRGAFYFKYHCFTGRAVRKDTKIIVLYLKFRWF